AGAGVHRCPAPLAALPSRRGLRLRARLRWHPLPVLSRARRWRRHPRRATCAGTGACAGCDVRGRWPMTLFDALVRGGQLRPLDVELAATLRRLDPDTPGLVLAGAALASLAVGSGDAAFDPARPRLPQDAGMAWPAASEWQAAFAASRWVAHPSAGDASAQAPLVFDQGLLYLRRYREYEHRLAEALRTMAARAPANAGDEGLQALFDALFPDPGAGGEDLQATAARLALRRSLALVTGGPGTGKTTTITRLLLLLLEQARQAGAEPP